MSDLSLERIKEAMQTAADAPEGIQPSVLMHRNIDHEQVGEYTSSYVNDSWAPRLKKLIDDGWIVFHIQTEFGINGHVTMAYLAKMEVN